MTDAQMMDSPDHAAQLARLRAIMHRLRAPGGCPWDAEQTHESLIPNLIEETHETVDTIRRGDHEHLKEELGDLLLQVVFHSELAEEAGRFNLDAAIRTSSRKAMPPPPMPCCNNGMRSSAPRRAMRNSLTCMAWAKDCRLSCARRNCRKKPRKPASTGPMRDELGDLMFSVVNLARFRKADPEVLMAAANAKFEQRFAAMERALQQQGIGLAEATPDQMERAWQAAKT